MALATAVLMAGCGGSDAAEPVGTRPPDTVEVFGGLTIRLRFATNRVVSGGDLTSQLKIENRSGHDVTDPGCQLASGPHAIVPADDPAAELWQVAIVDCGGPHVYPNGATDSLEGPRFRAATKYGEPLPPGDYVAAWEIDGRRLEHPISVVEEG